MVRIVYIAKVLCIIDLLKLNDKFSVVVKDVSRCGGLFAHFFTQPLGQCINLDMHALLLNNKLTIILNLTSSLKKSNVDKHGEPKLFNIGLDLDGLCTGQTIS